MDNIDKLYQFDGFGVRLMNDLIVYQVNGADGGILLHPLPAKFAIEIDKPENGGRIQIKFRDRWGSEMIFIHYDPTPLESMFRFIAKGYGIVLPDIKSRLDDIPDLIKR